MGCAETDDLTGPGGCAGAAAHDNRLHRSVLSVGR
jgi:hypothetical protein